MSDIIYKICTGKEWAAALEAGVYSGSLDDKRDGFIHFSTQKQVKRTLAKYFSGQADLLLLAIDVSLLNPLKLKYEGKKGADKYPHLYGALSPSAVQAQYPVCLSAANEHIIDY